MTRDINIIYGITQTGKSIFAKHGFKLLDFKILTDIIKKKLTRKIPMLK